MCKLVLVDFDDTLVATAPAFEKARTALFDRLVKEGFARARAEHVHHDLVEPELLALFGMGPFRLEPSFRDTYLRLCHEDRRPPDRSVADECSALGRDFMGNPEVLDGALEALDALSSSHPTAIYSQASHPEYQRGRIARSGVAEILSEDRIVITAHKTPESLQRTLVSFGVPHPSEALMIGNSLRSDVNPALLLGVRAVLVEPYEMWYYDRVPPISDEFLRFTTFPEAVEYLLAGEGGACPALR
jgi:putative hydrolase of the HAD superfamily